MCCGLSPRCLSFAHVHRGADPVIEERQIRAPVSRLHALELPPEEPIDVRRDVLALRRSRDLIPALVIGWTGLVLLLSLMLPKTYTAQATILFDEAPS